MLVFHGTGVPQALPLTPVTVCDYLADVHAQVSEELAALSLGQLTSAGAKTMPLSPLEAPSSSQDDVHLARDVHVS